MAENIPKISELESQYLNNYASRLGVDVSDLGDSYIVEAKTQAAVVYSLYLKLSKVQNNIYPDLAEMDVLMRYGYAILGRYPEPATQGVFSAIALGTGTIPAQTQFVANNDTSAAGKLYIVDQDWIISTSGIIEIRALEGGIASDLNQSDKLTSIQPLTGIDNEIVVTLPVIVEPVDAEDIEQYRQDVLAGIRILPQGGAPGDYRLWTLEIPEVRTVYPFLNTTEIGDVLIYVEATPEATKAGEETGVPTQDTLDDVYTAPSGGNPESGAVIYDSVEQRGRKPITVNNIIPQAVTPIPVDIDFTDLSDENIADSIRTALDSYLYEIRPFVAGAQSLRSKNDILTIGGITAQILEVLTGTGITYTNLDMSVSGVGSIASFTFLFGNYPYLRNINNNGSPI